jgi:diguanylate cyclase (GGDEF)-like protein/PAS domain S-box-containing protein
MSSRTSAPDKGSPQALLVNALVSVATAIFITDRSGRIVWANEAFSRLSGYPPEEVIGSTPGMLVKSDMQSKDFYEGMWNTILAGKAWRGVLVDRRKDGTLYSVDESITPLFGEDGAISHFIAIQQDIALRNEQVERDRYLAYHDALTGLANRRLFEDIEQQALARSQRLHELVALMFLDLDKFKPVNDSLGHGIGDQLLLAVAERLSAAIRRSDCVARIGGDEFAVLVPGLEDSSIAAMLAAKLVDAIARPFVIAEHRIQIASSIGIAMFPTDSQESDELMRKADQAMYFAKGEGGNAYRFYDKSLDRRMP